MNTANKYVILTSYESDLSLELVNERLLRGWSTCGGLVVESTSYEDRHGSMLTDRVFYQAMELRMRP